MVNKLKELRETGSEEGFTLIELMIVVVIIGILAAIAIPIFMNQQKAAIVAGVESDVKNTVNNIVTALVKKPYATISLAPGAETGTIGSAIFKSVVSDPNTRISAGGLWSNYWVQGTNSSIGDVPGAPWQIAPATNGWRGGHGFSVVYCSLTGKTVTKEG